MSTNFRRKMKYKNILTKKFLIQEYIKNRKSVHEIAEQINFYDSIIYIYLIRYNISRRTQSEAMKGKYIRKRSWKYIDNRTNKQHYCIESNCNNKISYSNWLNGNRRCGSHARMKQWQDKDYREKYMRVYDDFIEPIIKNA